MKRRILVILPTLWDRRQLESCRDTWEAWADVHLSDPSEEEYPEDFNASQAIDRWVEDYRGVYDGVFSSSDYPGVTMAGAIATAWGLPGTPPGILLRCAHKYESRRVQERAVPEATPLFDLVDTRHPDRDAIRVGFPCFVKPVKGAFSVLARRFDDRESMRRFLGSGEVRRFADEYLSEFNRLVARYTDFSSDGHGFIVEALLRGQLVTVEGFVKEGRVSVIGIVDSLTDPETGSFVRFEYPSRLPGPVLDRMRDIARRLIEGLALEDGFFNIEMIRDPQTSSVHVIEVNPRLCGQFADLYQKVDGRSSYEMALAIAAGVDLEWPSGAGRYSVAASRPLRLFDPGIVRSAPSLERVSEIEREFPATMIWLECQPGEDLSDFGPPEDGSSRRYAVINAGAASHEELDLRLTTIEQRLGFEFTPRES